MQLNITCPTGYYLWVKLLTSHGYAGSGLVTLAELCDLSGSD